MKNLPFYEEARVVDAKARQDRLESREKKHQEGTLRQALGGSHPATSSTTLPQTKGKFVSQSVGKALDLSPFTSSPTSSFEAGTNQGSTDSPSIRARLNQEVEPVVSCIILDPKEEEREKGMTPNLRYNFKERQRKCLSEALLVAPPLAKRTRLEVSYEDLVLDAPKVQVPPSNIVRSEQELVASSYAEKDACPAEDGTLVVHTLGGDINDKNASISSPSYEEIAALLKQVPCSTAPEPPTPSIDVLFPLTHQYFVDLSGDPPITFAPRLPHNISNSVLLCIQPIQQYIAVEKGEVVRFAS